LNRTPPEKQKCHATNVSCLWVYFLDHPEDRLASSQPTANVRKGSVIKYST